MTILSPTSFLTWLLIHTMHAWGLAQAWGRVLSFLFTQTSYLFAYPLMFLFYLVHQVGPPPSISSQGDPLHCDQTLDPTRTHLLCYSHGGEWIASYHVIRDAFASIFKKNKFSCFAWTNPCPSIPFSLIFSSTGWHRVINQSHLHLCGCGD
jgi:hypothetical protein